MWYETLLIYADSAKTYSKDTLDVRASDDEMEGMFDAVIVQFDHSGVWDVEPAAYIADDGGAVVAADIIATFWLSSTPGLRVVEEHK